MLRWNMPSSQNLNHIAKKRWYHQIHFGQLHTCLAPAEESNSIMNSSPPRSSPPSMPICASPKVMANWGVSKSICLYYTHGTSWLELCRPDDWHLYPIHWRFRVWYQIWGIKAIRPPLIPFTFCLPRIVANPPKPPRLTTVHNISRLGSCSLVSHNILNNFPQGNWSILRLFGCQLAEYVPEHVPHHIPSSVFDFVDISLWLLVIAESKVQANWSILRL